MNDHQSDRWSLGESSVAMGVFILLFGGLGLGMVASIASAGDATIEERASAAVDVIFVLDNSGSMKDNDPDFLARTAVRNFARALESDPTIDGRIGVVLFDGRAHLVRALAASPEDSSGTPLADALSRLDFSGQRTNSPAGIERALYEFRQHGRADARRAIVLLTDGKIDTGDDRDDLEASRWLREDLADESLASGIRIFGVAFTDAADYQLMQALAQRTSARYYRAYRATELGDVVEDVLARITRDDTDRVDDVAAGLPVALDESRVDVAAARAEVVDDSRFRSLGWLPLAIAFVAGAVVWQFRRRSGGADAAKREAVRANAPPQAQLLDLDGHLGRRGAAIELGGDRTRIGRDAHNELMLDADAISSEHAVIEFRDGHYWIEDLRSTNGTSLGDQLLVPGQRVQLKGGDHIRLADIDLMFVLAGYVPGGATVFLDPTTTPPSHPNSPGSDLAEDSAPDAPESIGRDAAAEAVESAAPPAHSGQLSLLRSEEESEPLESDQSAAAEPETSDRSDLAPSVDPARAEVAAIRRNLDDHIGRVAAISEAFGTFVDRAFEAELRGAIAVSARDLVSEAGERGGVVRKDYTFDRVRYVLCGVSGSVERARDLFAERFGGFTRLLSEELHADSFRSERCEILAVLTFGIDGSPWVSLSIVPDEGQDPRIDLLSYEFLSAAELEEIELHESSAVHHSGLG